MEEVAVLRKIVNNLANVGFVLLVAGLLYYIVTGVWDWIAQVGVYSGGALILLFLVLHAKEIRRTFGTRMGRMGTTALATFLLVLAILVMLNFLNFRHHKRIDLSEGELHSLSPQTRKILENLDQKIEVIGFFQESTEAARFQETIQEYHYLSPQLEFEIIDPQENPGRVGQYQITRDGQVVVAGPNKREIVDDPTEEKITNAIIKVTRDEEKVIYFLSGHGERGIDDSGDEGYSTAKQEIEKQNYRVKSYNLALENRVPDDAAAIVSTGPTVDFFPNEISLLDEYLAAGGKFFLLVDAGAEVQMNDFLEKYGITLQDDFVVDATGVGQLFGFGAAAPLAAEYPDHPITEDLRGTMTIYPMARSVRSTSSSLDYESKDLVLSSARSWGESDPTGERVAFDEGVDEQGPLALAVVATKSLPEQEDGGDSDSGSEGVEQEQVGEDPRSNLDESSSSERESRLVVVGDADFASNAYMDISANGDLFLNVISWLAEDTDLISVRAKNPEARSMTLTAAESKLIFLATVVFFPLAALMLGAAIWLRRRAA
jgi:ABC-type uncharacterized transport system involved in gliding motility auxiliary subunit